MKFKLKKGPRQRWIDALRSGKFKQGYAALAGDVKGGTPGCYCVLGVATELYRRSISPRPQWQEYTDAFNVFGLGLPYEAQEYLGVGDDFDDVRLNLSDLTPETFRAIDDAVLGATGNRNFRWDSAWLSALNDIRVPFGLLADVIEQCTEAA